MKKQNIAPIKTYTLTTEQLALYQDTKPINTIEYPSFKNLVLDDDAIYSIGKTVGYNCMKKQYQLRGLEDYNPNNPCNWATLDDFQGNAILAIYEYCKSNDLIGIELTNDTFTDEDMHQLRLVGYKACNQEGRAIRQNVYKHLYIETLVNEDGEPTFEVVDVTAQIQLEEVTANSEIIKELWQYLKPTQRKVVKYVAQGYTDETISKMLGCTRQNVNKIKHTYRKKALAVVKASPQLTEQLKGYIK